MKRSLLLFILLLHWLAAHAQNFTAQIEDVNGYYRLTFTATSKDASHFTPPSLDDFEILSGPNLSTFSNFQMVNGRASHTETKSFTYILSAKKSGKLSIGPASVRVGKRTLRSAPLSFDAKAGTQSNKSHSRNQGQAGGNGGNADEVQQIGSNVTQRDLFIDVTPSRTRVREQEAVLLTYKIHSRVGVGLANTQLTTKPDFKGLISQEIPLPGNQIQTSLEHRNGTTYRTGTILQYLVFPQQSGEITIPSIVFDCTVVQQDRTMDLADAFFNGGGSIGVQVRRTVPVTKIQVDALPQPKPANFSGAVGKFHIEAKVLNPSVRTNDVATYRVSLNGLGNLKLITAPVVKFPNDFDTYDAKTNENTKVTQDGLTGQLTFDYTFVPRNVGKYEIPAIEFTYFDTETGSYQTIRTRPIPLNVEKGERSNADVDHQLALLRSDIHDIHTSGFRSGRSAWLMWGTWNFTVLNLLVIALLAACIAGLRRYASLRADVTGRRRSGAAKQAERRLHEAEKLLQSPAQADFYAAVSKALTLYITDTFGVGQADLSHERIRQLLTEKGADAEAIDGFLDVMQTCQFAQYAPGADQQRNEVYQKAIQVLQAIQK